MLQIRCPNCGVRDEIEFRFGGEAGIERPDVTVNDERWSSYLYVRQNTKGVHPEIWCHVHGCNKWFVVERNTATHEIARTLKLDKHIARVKGGM